MWRTSFKTRQEEAAALAVGLSIGRCQPPPDWLEMNFSGFSFSLVPLVFFCFFFSFLFVARFCLFLCFVFFFVFFSSCCLCFFGVWVCTIYRPFAGRSAVAADGDSFNYLVLLVTVEGGPRARSRLNNFNFFSSYHII